MVQLKIPQLGFFLRSEANVKFLIAFVMLLVALYWANRTHRQRNLQIKQEEREDKIIIVVSTIVFLIVTVIVYRAFNQFGESLNPETLREAMKNKETGLDESGGLGARNQTGEGFPPERLTFVDRLKRWLGGGDGMKKKDFKTLILEAAIYGVLTTIVILLVLICYPVTCRECNEEELKEQELHNHPVPSSPSMPTTTGGQHATTTTAGAHAPPPTQGMVLSRPHTRRMPEMTASAAVPSPRLTPLSSARDRDEETAHRRASGETSRGDNRTPPEDLTNHRLDKTNK